MAESRHSSPSMAIEVDVQTLAGDGKAGNPERAGEFIRARIAEGDERSGMRPADIAFSAVTTATIEVLATQTIDAFVRASVEKSTLVAALEAEGPYKAAGARITQVKINVEAGDSQRNNGRQALTQKV